MDLGLFETNGSFVVNIIKNNNFSSGYGVSINYTFRSIENDLLDYVQNLLKNKDINSKIKNNTLLIVGLENLQKFVKMINECGNFITIKRQKEFIVFKEILYLYQTKEHLTKAGVKKIKLKKDQLK